MLVACSSRRGLKPGPHHQVLQGLLKDLVQRLPSARALDLSKDVRAVFGLRDLGVARVEGAEDLEDVIKAIHEESLQAVEVGLAQHDVERAPLAQGRRIGQQRLGDELD